MLNSNNIYIIKSNINFEDDFFDSIYDFKDSYQLIFSDLETAKNELKEIFNKTPDFKFYEFKICIYTLRNNRYENTNDIYTYSFDKFTKN